MGILSKVLIGKAMSKKGEKKAEKKGDEKYDKLEKKYEKLQAKFDKMKEKKAGEAHAAPPPPPPAHDCAALSPEAGQCPPPPPPWGAGFGAGWNAFNMDPATAWGSPYGGDPFSGALGQGQGQDQRSALGQYSLALAANFA